MRIPGLNSKNRLDQAGLALIGCIVAAWVLWMMPHPLSAIAAGLVPLAAIVCLRRPFLLVLAFVLFSFFRLHEVFPALYPLHIPQLLALATLASLAWNLTVGTLRPVWCRELTAFAAFFGLVTAGLFFATNRGEALASWQGTYVKIAVMVVAIVWLARGERELKLVTRAVVVTGILVGGVALHNKLGGIGLVEGTRVTIGRDIGSILGDPNDLALVLLFPASFGLALLFTRAAGWPARFLGGVGFAVVLAAIVATQSRGGLLGIVAVAGVFAWRHVRSKSLLVAAGTIALVLLFAMAEVGDRSSGGALEEGIDESAMGRLHAWGAAVEMAMDNPLTGVGINNFLSNYFAYSSFWDGRNHAVHSTWFGVMAETGIIGFMAFAVMVVLVLRSALWATTVLAPGRPRHAPEPYAMAQGVLAGLAGFMVSGTFLTMGFTWPLYILLALTAAVAGLAREPSQINSHFESERR
jgi:putative inorganic carbon (hco3(-)) transporter